MRNCHANMGVLKLTNIMEIKSIPKLCKLNPIPVCQGAGKFRFFFLSKNIPSNTYSKIYLFIVTSQTPGAIRRYIDNLIPLNKHTSENRENIKQRQFKEGFNSKKKV